MTDIFETLESEVRGYCRSWPAVFTRGEGSSLTAEDGRTYLDFFSGAGALNYGHNNPQLLQPLLEYLASGGVVHSLDMKTAGQTEVPGDLPGRHSAAAQSGLQGDVPRPHRHQRR